MVRTREGKSGKLIVEAPTGEVQDEMLAAKCLDAAHEKVVGSVKDAFRDAASGAPDYWLLPFLRRIHLVMQFPIYDWKVEARDSEQFVSFRIAEPSAVYSELEPYVAEAIAASKAGADVSWRWECRRSEEYEIRLIDGQYRFLRNRAEALATDGIITKTFSGDLAKYREQRAAKIRDFRRFDFEDSFSTHCTLSTSDAERLCTELQSRIRSLLTQPYETCVVVREPKPSILLRKPALAASAVCLVLLGAAAATGISHFVWGDRSDASQLQVSSNGTGLIGESTADTAVPDQAPIIEEFDRESLIFY